MTWGELRRFVDLAGREHVDDSETVTLACDYDDPNSPPIGLTFSSLDDVADYVPSQKPDGLR
jgi:hypothetical protein